MKDIKTILKNMKVNVSDKEYTIVSLSPGTKFKGNAFVIINGEDGTTVIIEKDEWKRMSDGFSDFEEESGFRIVLLDIALEWDVVGFLAAIAKPLADAGISIGAFCAYSKDYLLVKSKDIDKAIKVFETLKK